MLKKLFLCFSLALVLSGCASNSSLNLNTDKAPKKINQTIIEPSQDTSDKQPLDNPAKLPLKPVEVPNILGLQTKKIGWSWKYLLKSNADLLSKYQGYAFGDITSKEIYLTFDEGYENGFTASILDTLKANNVQAAFFVTGPFVTGTFNGVNNIDLVKRMSSEGHLIANHSVHHKSMPSFIDENAFNAELTGVQSAVDSIKGTKMSKFFRPPMGEFSELSLYYTQKLGYKSIFFSLAYNDWDPKNQPDPLMAKQTLLKETKPGMICLLHAVSKTNALILDDLIKEWKLQGYKFKSLNELP